MNNVRLQYQIQLQMMLKAACLRKRITAQFENKSRTLSASDKSRSSSEVSVAISDSPILPIEYSYGSSFKYVSLRVSANLTPRVIVTLIQSELNAQTLPQPTEQCRSQLCALYPAGKILHITQSKLFREG